eukprot:jgi/Chlat1/6100/Chrsp40S05677
MVVGEGAGVGVPVPQSGGMSERKGHKRKLADASFDAAGAAAREGAEAGAAEGTGASTSTPGTSTTPAIGSGFSPAELQEKIQRLVNALRTLGGSIGSGPAFCHRPTARKVAHELAELAKHEDSVETIVAGGAIEVLVPLLSPPASPDPLSAAQPPRLQAGNEEDHDEVEKEAAFALGLLAIKPEHQRRIANAGALPALVALIHKCAAARRKTEDRSGLAAPAPELSAAVARRAADAITNLAHENVVIKSRVRAEGGIPPLVALLDSPDSKVQRAAAGALRTLAFKNDENKAQIVECGALPTLIFMLKSEDVGIHYEAVGVIGNLVHSSHLIKKRVLDEGALQPVIGLLSSKCPESQREAALLLGQFATTDPEYKSRIAQRGAVRPLISMLSVTDPQLREMAAFALGRLAQQNPDNQAGIVHAGGLRPLLDLLECRNGSLQHNAAFALYGLADNEENVASMVREGGVQQLLDGQLIVQASKDCVQKTINRLESKIHGQTLRLLLSMLHSSDRSVRYRVATALAHLLKDVEHQRAAFIEHGGLEVLLEMLSNVKSPVQQQESASALFALVKKASLTSPMENAPPPPTPQVYLGEQYVNCQTLSDVTFVVEGHVFYAHRIALLASSDTFRAMFDGGYREKEAKNIEIPNISWKAFEAMMRCIYTGTVEVTADIAQELLRAADQYLLEGLKRLCEFAIAQDLTVENVSGIYELADTYHAPTLKQHCVVFTLEHYQQLVAARGVTGYGVLVQRMLPQVRKYIQHILRTHPHPAAVVAAAAVVLSTAHEA